MRRSPRQTSKCNREEPEKEKREEKEGRKRWKDDGIMTHAKLITK